MQEKVKKFIINDRHCNNKRIFLIFSIHFKENGTTNGEVLKIKGTAIIT
ncbi:hypothetical protein AAJ76_3000130562 [Vairimorpha ceranae]|uniref:Uncharacterized protein n=1 Tax=Vairimorpha ceranae TaxID=40302 RepID=A0A0F9YVL8_9MICR|nr:hypothetical protein AAJ76_3000130562 [Vairimorpha ceranae]KKO76462.1 hypothetical protein AAJ76_3000130562 [Vairimorpha ceranae]